VNASLLRPSTEPSFILRYVLVFSVFFLGLAASFVSAEDFKLSDGTIFRHVRVVEVRPDALVFSHDRGMAMAELEKLPKAIRARYGYDARKAAVYRLRETMRRRAETEENQRLIAAHANRVRELTRAHSDAADVDTAAVPEDRETNLSLRFGESDRAYATAVSHLETKIAQAEEARTTEIKTAQTFWGAPFWKHPLVIFLCGLLGGGGAGQDGSNSEPRNWR